MFARESDINYKIAEIENPNTIIDADTMLSRGLILKLQVHALDSQKATELTRFKITIKPVHRMPSNSKIKVKFPTLKNKIILEQADLATCIVGSDDTTLIDPSLAKCEVNTATNEVSALFLFGENEFPKDGPEFSFSVSARGRNPEKSCGYI